MKLLPPVLALLLTASGPAAAQLQTGNLYGTITDEGFITAPSDESLLVEKVIRSLGRGVTASPPRPEWLPLSYGRLSSKNQLTLPTAATRALGWRPGDEIELMLHGDMIVLSRLPRTPEEWLSATAGAASHIEEWSTDEKIDAWTRGIREEWDEERDWETDDKRS